MSDKRDGSIENFYEKLSMLVKSKDNLKIKSEMMLEALETNTAEVNNIQSDIQKKRWQTFYDPFSVEINKAAAIERYNQRDAVDEIIQEAKNIDTTLLQTEQEFSKLKIEYEEVETILPSIKKRYNDEIDRRKSISAVQNKVREELKTEINLKYELEKDIQALIEEHHNLRKFNNVLHQSLSEKKLTLKSIEASNEECKQSISNLNESLRETENNSKERCISFEQEKTLMKKKIDALQINLTEINRVDETYSDEIKIYKEQSKVWIDKINKAKKILEVAKSRESIRTQTDIIEGILYQVENQKETQRKIVLEQEQKLAELKSTEHKLTEQLEEQKQAKQIISQEITEYKQKIEETKTNLRNLDAALETFNKTEQNIAQMMVQKDTLENIKLEKEAALRQSKDSIEGLNMEIALLQDELNKTEEMLQKYNTEGVKKRTEDYEMKIRKYQKAIDKLKAARIAAKRKQYMQQVGKMFESSDSSQDSMLKSRKSRI